MWSYFLCFEWYTWLCHNPTRSSDNFKVFKITQNAKNCVMCEVNKLKCQVFHMQLPRETVWVMMWRFESGYWWKLYWWWCVSEVRWTEVRPDDGMCLIPFKTQPSCWFSSCLRWIYLQWARMPYLLEVSPAAGHSCQPVAHKRDRDLPCTSRSQTHSKAGQHRRGHALSPKKNF